MRYQFVFAIVSCILAIQSCGYADEKAAPASISGVYQATVVKDSPEFTASGMSGGKIV